MAKRHKELLGALDVARAKAGLKPSQRNDGTLDFKHAEPVTKPYRLADGGGLYLWVPTTGVKAWQFRYRHGGKPQTATLGKVSDVQSLAWARARAQEARSRVEAGEHLTRVKAAKKAAKRASAKNTFTAVAGGWIAQEARRAPWSAGHRKQVVASLENHLSDLNALPVTEITAAIAMPLIRRVERESPEAARKMRQRLRSILDYAVEEGLIQANPLPTVRRRRKGAGERAHLPAVLSHDGVGEILRAADRAEGSRGVKRAHALAAFTAQRIGEIVGAEWTEFDLDKAIWSIPRSRMKRKDENRGPHVVPLPPHLLAKVIEWKRVDGDTATYVCPTPHGDGFVTREAVEKYYRRTLGLTGKHSPHSWRAVLSTWAADAGEDSDAVEAQLDHVTGSPTKVAYDRAQRVDRRVPLMTRHEEALIAARDGAKVLRLDQRKVKQ